MRLLTPNEREVATRQVEASSKQSVYNLQLKVAELTAVLNNNYDNWEDRKKLATKNFEEFSEGISKKKKALEEELLELENRYAGTIASQKEREFRLRNREESIVLKEEFVDNSEKENERKRKTLSEKEVELEKISEDTLSLNKTATERMDKQTKNEIRLENEFVERAKTLNDFEEVLRKRKIDLKEREEFLIKEEISSKSRRKELEFREKEIQKQTKHIESQQKSLKAAFDEAKRMGIYK